MKPIQCPTHRYRPEQKPTRSCATCWAAWVWKPNHNIEHVEAAWAKVDAKGMKRAVQQALKLFM